MARILYELVGANDLRFSPYCWRTRLALAHKGLEASFEPVRFTEKEKIAFSGSTTVPVLKDGERAIADSWEIACYLEEAYPDRPSLFGGEAGRAVTGFINAWTNATLHPALLKCTIKDVFERLDPDDSDYFRSTREARFGKTIEELDAERDTHVAALATVLAPLRTILEKEAWISGDAPAYADYIVFGAFQWIRLVSPLEPVFEGDPVFDWRERMLDLFGGLARSHAAASA